MGKKELYKKVSNPLNDGEVIKKVLYAYLFHKDIDLYHSSSKDEDIKKGKNLLYKELIRKLLFQLWQDSIKTLDTLYNELDTKTIKIIEEANGFDFSGYNKEEIQELAKDICQIKYKNSRDISKAIKQIASKDEESKRIFSKYFFIKPYEDKWIYINSSLIKCGREKGLTPEHELHIKCDNEKTELFVYNFINKCLSKSLSFNFKYTNSNEFADSLIVYCDSENIEEYIRIINEIIDENNLKDKMQSPMKLSGKIGDYIGYTSYDPNKTFTERRINHINKCIKQEAKRYIEDRLEKQERRPNGYKVPYKYQYQRKLLSIIRNKYYKIIKNNNISLSNSDLISDKFEKKFMKATSNNIEYIIKNIEFLGDDFRLEIPYKRNIIVIDKDDIEELIIFIILGLLNEASDYFKDLCNRVKETSFEIGIDPDNYSFDLKKAYKLGKPDNFYNYILSLEPTDESSPKKKAINKK